MRKWIITTAATVAAFGLWAQIATGPGEARGGSSEQPGFTSGEAALHQLFEAEWEYWMRESPTWASTLGGRR